MGEKISKDYEKLQIVQHMCNDNIRRRSKKGVEDIFEMIMAEILLKLKSDTKAKIWKVQRIPSRINVPLPPKKQKHYT